MNVEMPPTTHSSARSVADTANPLSKSPSGNRKVRKNLRLLIEIGFIVNSSIQYNRSRTRGKNSHGNRSCIEPGCAIPVLVGSVSASRRICREGRRILPAHATAELRRVLMSQADVSANSCRRSKSLFSRKAFSTRASKSSSRSYLAAQCGQTLT